MSRNIGSTVFIVIVVLLDSMSLGLIMPVLPRLLGHLTGAGVASTATIYGSLLTTSAAMVFLFSPALGRLSDHVGRRPVLFVSLAGAMLVNITLATANSLWLIFAAQVAGGICGGSVLTARAYIADVTAREKRGQAYGLLSAVFGIGLVLGPALGGFMGDVNVRMPFWAAAALAALNLAYGIALVPESLAPANRRPFDWRAANPFVLLASLWRRSFLVRGLIFVAMADQLASALARPAMILFTQLRFSWTGSEVGAALGLLAITSFAAQAAVLPLLLQRMGQWGVILLGLVTIAASAALASVATAGWQIYALLAAFGLGTVAAPAMQGILSSEFSDAEQGELQGGLVSLLTVVTIAGPLAGTGTFAFFVRAGAPIYFPGAPFVLAALLWFGALLIVWFLYSRRAPASEAPETPSLDNIAA